MSLLRRAALLPVLLLLFPPSALADTIQLGWYFGNTGGVASFNPTTQTLSLTSNVTTLLGTLGHITGNFGTITVTTGPLISGNLFHSALFGDGTISITSNGGPGFTPFSFSGTLFGLKLWVDKSGTLHLTAAGGVGTFVFTDGQRLEGIADFRQVLVPTGANTFSVSRGATSVPEPASAILVVTGLGLLATRAKSVRKPIS